MADVSLAKGDENNPLLTFADKVSEDQAQAPSTTAGVSAPGSPEDLSSIQPLSQMAWENDNPQFADDSLDAPENGDVSTSETFTPALGGGPTGMSSPGVSDLGEVPDLNTRYGNPNGGNFVTDDATTGETIVKVAKAMLGKPYIWGGEGWGGADCSGLVQLAYAQAGIEMPRLSNYQMNKGKQVDYKDLKPGDLIGWNNSNHVVGADHIAIYIGNNQYIEAPRPGSNIRISDLMSYGTDMMWAVRIPSSKPIPAQQPRKAPKPKKPTEKETTSIRAIEGGGSAESKATPPKKKEKKPKTQAEMHSTGRLAVKN